MKKRNLTLNDELIKSERWLSGSEIVPKMVAMELLFREFVALDEEASRPFCRLPWCMPAWG